MSNKKSESFLKVLLSVARRPNSGSIFFEVVRPDVEVVHISGQLVHVMTVLLVTVVQRYCDGYDETSPMVLKCPSDFLDDIGEWHPVWAAVLRFRAAEVKVHAVKAVPAYPAEYVIGEHLCHPPR